MRLSRLSAMVALLTATALTAPATAPALAQTPAPAPAAKPGAAAAQPDPVVARVNGTELHLSDLQDAARGLPAQMQNVPVQALYPMLLDRLIDEQLLAAQARKEGLEKDPKVQHAIAMATDQVLQNALLQKEIGPKVTPEAVKAVYDKDYASKQGPEEIHAAHILVGNEDEAKKIIGQLNKGADFTKLAAESSTDPGTKKAGGDLGWFKKDEMVPAFANAAFALQPGQVSQTPVHTEFGWHVIKVEGKRTAAPETYEQAAPEIRRKLAQAGIQQALNQAKQGAKVEKFNMDGSPQRATDTAEPPPAPKP